MLEVGNGGMTQKEYRSHFALWALLKSPLLIGCDVRNMSAATLSILTASDVIALSQDKLGVAGDLIWKEGPNEVYAMPLSDGSRGVVMFNRHTHSTQYPLSKISVDFTDLVPPLLQFFPPPPFQSTFSFFFPIFLDLSDMV
jgi:alpha-galactosidase